MKILKQVEYKRLLVSLTTENKKKNKNKKNQTKKGLEDKIKKR